MGGKVLTGAFILALVGLLFWGFGKAKFNQGELAERVKWNGIILTYEKQKEELIKRNSEQQLKAAADYAERLRGQQPIILRSKETVTRYAETDAGKLLCLDANRVRGIEADRTFLFPGYSTPAGSSFIAMPTSADPDK